ncbi:hypothetical protein GWK08_01045 [Leptobacterium flavescens]|uniref:Sensor of ECF-type sigma factor n=1 Tax=Leptobacterium flavescens TaxID=472055 RepID=A0A6P0UFG9_9FLAO|nr:hypothetical protein [Leptobacterium flavescens]NER12014.1 hypothetical protein [Leptobacterium flavescens]
MKKYKSVIFLVFAMILWVNSYGQRGGNYEKIKSLKVAYITEKLSLTADEAEKFWPIYNSFEKNMHRLKREDLGKVRNRFKEQNFADISDKEAKEVLDEINNIERQMFELKQSLNNDLLRVISPKKVILLKKVEEDFNRDLLRKFRERRKQQFKERRN